MQTYIEKTALSDEMQTLKDKASALCKKYHVLAENDSWQRAVQAYRTVCDVVEAIEALPTVDIDAITETHEKIGYDKGFRDGYAQATVDAEQVIHGVWENKPHKMMGESPCCSVCGGFNPIETKFCPNCGAVMDNAIQWQWEERGEMREDGHTER